MTSHRQDRSQAASDGAALALSVVVLGLFLVAKPDLSHDPLVHPTAADQAGIEVSLLQALDTRPAPPPPPVPHKVPLHHVMPRPEAVPTDPLPAEMQNMPVADTVPEGGAVVAASNAAANSPAVDNLRPDLEAQYAAGLRADIDRRTHPPDWAEYRLHPRSGEVRVGFIVMRNGEPKVVHVLRTSGSPALDNRAVAIVSAGRYPPMPDKIFVGEAEHAFAVTIEFRAPS
jgi:TonB family protein